MRDLCPSRRGVLRGLAAAGVGTIGAGVLVACGGDEAGGAAPPSGQSVPAAEVPVGEARVVQVGDQPVVVAQPTEGEYVAFSAICTHQGTAVNTVDEPLEVGCPAHGSRFSATDGSVLNPPAEEPLPAYEVALEGDRLVFA